MQEFDKYKFDKYDGKYKKLYSQEKTKLKKFLSNSIKIEHIGSTSIPGLGGKGIIDIFISTRKKEINKIKKNLEKHRYTFIKISDDKQRLFFQKDYRYKEKTRRIHIHLTWNNSKNWKDTLHFRNLLRKNVKLLKKYEKIKKIAIKKSKGDGKKYRKHKDNFFKKMLKKKDIE